MFYLCLFLSLFVIVVHCRKMGLKRAAVVVLGDIGRSPRMQYHALSIADEGFLVDLIGYGGSTPHREIVIHPNINRCEMPDVPKSVDKLPRLYMYVAKVLWQAVVLFFTMMWQNKPSHILLQNPPAIPTLAVCWLVSALRGSKFIIDWHNYGYTILGLSLGDSHQLVRTGTKYEKFFGRFSAANICVTRAMKEDLRVNWGIQAETMYDRPPEIFQSTDLETQHELFSRLAKEYPVFRSRSGGQEETAFTSRESGSAERLAGRPALLVSSTSWTEDEDFSLLLNALDQYEEWSSTRRLPELVVAITGKGPLKAHYQRVISERAWRRVSVVTPWLEAEDYPRLLGSADLGVCLHLSSSGLDLPMKVVDMFGCGLPVCAVRFNCLSELVRHGENGMVFTNETELADQILELLGGFPSKCEKLAAFRQNLRAFQALRWKEAWAATVRPLFK